MQENIEESTSVDHNCKSNGSAEGKQDEVPFKQPLQPITTVSSSKSSHAVDHKVQITEETSDTSGHSVCTKSESSKTTTPDNSHENESSTLQTKQIKPKELKFPYNEPSWSGLPEMEYKFEVLKNGTIVSTVNLSKRPFTVFGRFSTCDVMMEHPSISRYHAVLQYRAKPDENNPKGFYLYDLESTHGTFLNKMQIKPRSYCRIHVGHVVKFGGSTKMFILQGPSDDEEEESELTVTEIKELRKQQLLALKAEGQQANEEGRKSPENDGIDWGLGEDAVEISQENPFALSTANEELYLDDPKKTLKGWFEREGYELEYDIEEKGFGHFVCRVQLPIDVGGGEYVPAEASVKGKKKEAVVACALEACRILDRYGLLRQSHQESRKRKQKNWEEDDYYESDEDIYLDRTGTIEKKREMRKKMVKKDETVETYDTLVAKLNDVNQEISTIQQKLSQSQHQEEIQTNSSELDSLDAYMSSLKPSESLDKKTRSKLRLQLAQLQQEQRRIAKMVELARPVSLPSFESRETSRTQAKPRSNKFTVITGTMKGHASLKTKNPDKPPSADTKTSDYKKEDAAEEEEEEEESDKDDSVQTTHAEKPALSQSDHARSTKAPDSEGTAAKLRIIGPSLPQNKNEEGQKPSKTEIKKRKPKLDDSKCEYDASNPDYAMWIPPEDQRGDGITSLNEKYGY